MTNKSHDSDTHSLRDEISDASCSQCQHAVGTDVDDSARSTTVSYQAQNSSVGDSSSLGSHSDLHPPSSGPDVLTSSSAYASSSDVGSSVSSSSSCCHPYAQGEPSAHAYSHGYHVPPPHPHSHRHVPHTTISMSSEKDMYEGSRGVYGHRDSGMQKSSSMMHHDMLEDDQLPIAEQYYRMGKRPYTTHDEKKKKSRRRRGGCCVCCCFGKRDDEHRAKERRQPERRRCRCAVHRCTVYLVFMALIFGGIATFFCWPRTPMVVVSSYAQRQDPQKATQWGITPDKRPWMEGQWLINITLDNHENWIPTHIAKIDFTLLDSLTQQPFAVANVEDLVVPPHTNTILANTNFYVHYSARTEADTTYQDLYHACAQLKQGQDRASINVNMKVVFHYVGILWSSTVIASPPSGGFICPM